MAMTCSFLTCVLGGGGDSRWMYLSMEMEIRETRSSFESIGNLLEMRRKQHNSLSLSPAPTLPLSVQNLSPGVGGTLLSTRAPQMAKEIVSPSVELVPLPNSSTMTKLHLEMLVSMKAISRISLEKVLTLNSIPSSTEMRVNNCSNNGNEAYSAGTLPSAHTHLHLCKEKTY